MASKMVSKMASTTGCIAVTALLVFASLQITGVQGQDSTCLGCLCEASTSCNATAGCSSPSLGRYFCGPFRISQAYWIDAGKPILGGDDPERRGAFENCANDVHCAADTLINYMKKFKQDCNADGVVDCTDYAFLHNLGGYGCKDPAFVTTEYFQRFLACNRVLTAATG